MSALKLGQKIEPDARPSPIDLQAPFTGSPIVTLLRRLLHHHLELRERKEKAETCLTHAIGHVPDEQERRAMDWIWPKGGLRTPWTSAMEFFSLHGTGIKESILREYLATVGVAVRLGQHPHAAITGNVPIVSRLVALNEAGFTAKLEEHLRQEFPDEMDAIIGDAPSKSEQSSVAEGPVEAGKKKGGADARGNQPQLRSWIQRDLDAAIREYKAGRASIYNDLVEGVRQGKPGAMKDARRLFGRNSIARALRVKARAMVTASEPWQEIARELKLSPKHYGQKRLNKSKRIGADLALEEHAEKQGDPTVEAVLNNEAIRIEKEVIHLARRKLPHQPAQEVIGKLQRGEITIELAQSTIDLYCANQERLREATG